VPEGASGELALAIAFDSGPLQGELKSTATLHVRGGR
jgi:hypothetical protein